LYNIKVLFYDIIYFERYFGGESMEKFYVTTPIYYVNSEPHIGSAYTTIVADVVARYKRMRGYDVFFLTGTDEHGQKVMQSAKAKNMSPKEYVDILSDKFRTLWKEMGLTYNHFIRTTDEEHEKTVQKIVSRLIENGDVYKGKYTGWYCISCEAFFNEEDTKLENGIRVCPDCGKELKWVEEENYFFRLSEYTDKILDFYEKNPDFVVPEFRKNEMLSILRSGLKDLSITRTTFDWGIPVKEDPQHVIYVWVDALINYISALGWAENDDNFKKYWPADLHLIGKEINRFHSIIWPAILMSAGIPLPKKVLAHGWLTVNGEKISKSKGNAIDPRILMNAYGKDVIRYYLLRDINFGKDGDFSEENLIVRYNSDLANDLSNLVHRTLSMLEKYFDGVIPENKISEDVDNQLLEIVANGRKKYFELTDSYSFTQALESLWEIIRFSNKYIDLTEPWKLGKDENFKDRLGSVMYNLTDSIRIIAILAYPVIPETSVKILEKLSLDFSHIKEENAVSGLLKSGSKTNKGEPVFVRIDPLNWERVIKMNDENLKTQEENVVSLIEFDDFTKVDLRIAKVTEAEKVQKSDKLLKIQLDVGELGKRQILAGISKYYTPEELIGKKIVIVSNLKPRKMMGYESQGMILAAKNENMLTVLTVDKDIEPGIRLS